MKSENNTSMDLDAGLLTDTSPSICDPALHRTARNGHTVLEILNGAIKTLDGKSRDGNI